MFEIKYVNSVKETYPQHRRGLTPVQSMNWAVKFMLDELSHRILVSTWCILGTALFFEGDY